MIYLTDRVPSPYVDESRDFQVLLRTYTASMNAIKFDADSMLNIIDTSNCRDEFLQLLATKVGFLTKKPIYNDDLRYVLEAFPYLVKNKGSMEAIIGAVNVFVKIKHIKTNTFININNTDHIIKIGIESSFTDTTVLDEMLKYLIPTGYMISYYFYKSIGNKGNPDKVKYVGKEFFDTIDIYKNSEMFGPTVDDDGTGSEQWSDHTKRIYHAVDTTLVASSEDISRASNTPNP